MSRTVTTEQVKQILRHQLQAQWADPKLASALPPAMIWGPPGIGKSSVIRALCSEMGIDFIDVRLSQREPVDMRGLPVPAGDQVNWLLSSEWPRDKNGRGIILFDELTAADRALQVAAYEFILDRRLGDLYQVPDGWLICAAGNRAEDQACSGALSSALANRFCHFEMTADLQAWLVWATAHDVHPEVLAFLRFQPGVFFSMQGDLQRGWPSPRSWERVSNVLKHAGELTADLVELQIVGLIGQPASVQFRAFRRNTRRLPDIPKLLVGQEIFEMPERADQCHALCIGLAHHLWNGSKETLRMRVASFLEITLNMSSDFATLAMMDALQAGTPEEQVKHAELLFSNPAFDAWTKKHGTTLASSQMSNGSWLTSPQSDTNFNQAVQKAAQR